MELQIDHESVIRNCLTDEGVTDELTTSMAQACLCVYMSGITKDNWEEFYTRLDVYDRVHGSPVPQVHEDLVNQFIGLKTNGMDKGFYDWLVNVIGANILRRYEVDTLHRHETEKRQLLVTMLKDVHVWLQQDNYTEGEVKAANELSYKLYNVVKNKPTNGEGF